MKKYNNKVANNEIGKDMQLYISLKQSVSEIDKTVLHLAFVSFSFDCKSVADKILLLIHSKSVKLRKMRIIRNNLKHIDKNSINLCFARYIKGKSDTEIAQEFDISRRSIYRYIKNIDKKYREIKHGKKHLFT